MDRTSKVGNSVQTSLQGIANKAKREKKYRFRNLAAMLTEEFFQYSWKFLRKDAATGVDRVTAEEYGTHFTTNVRALIERLKQGSYRAKLVLRKWIPKGENKFRPLGLPVLEDKLLQIAVALILRAIFEEDFLPCSYGYRPRVGARDAVKALRHELRFGRYRFVVEADIKGFFDNIDHAWLIRMLEQRIDDKRFLRLIKKWLKAGILEADGRVLHPITGTPQGGIVTPPTQKITWRFPAAWRFRNRDRVSDFNRVLANENFFDQNTQNSLTFEDVQLFRIFAQLSDKLLHMPG